MQYLRSPLATEGKGLSQGSTFLLCKVQKSPLECAKDSLGLVLVSHSMQNIVNLMTNKDF